MTQPFSSLPLQPTRGRRRVQRHRASLLGCFLGCLVAGCAERYDIGAFRDTQPQLQTGDVASISPGVGVLLADGVEDADVVLEGVNAMAASTPGDLDGDGFDDLVVTDNEWPEGLHILYGGPRPSDGVLHLAQRSSALSLDNLRYNIAIEFPRQGDFDGDGTNDLAVGVGETSFYTYGLTGEAAAEQDAALTDQMQRWTEQRAFLRYGSPERPAHVQFPSDAVAFRAGDDLSSHLARVLDEHAQEELEASISVGVDLGWLGDVDGDGHDDLALSTSFIVSWLQSARQHTEYVSYLYYGGARLEVGGEARQPDARLQGFFLTGLGDVNGDGLADVVAGDGAAPLDGGALQQLYVLPGSAQRLANEVSVQDLGVPLQLSNQLIPFGVGDLDGDGMGDLLSYRAHETEMFVDLVYGSPDVFQRPLDASRVNATFTGIAGRCEVYDGGDYDGDGMSDLLLYATFWKGEGSDDPSALQPYTDQARLIPGSTTRYAGAYDLGLIQPSGEPRRSDAWYAVVPGRAGDFDADGHADVVLTNDSDSRIKFGASLQSPVIR